MARREPEHSPSHPAQGQYCTHFPHPSSGLVFMIERNERAMESGPAGATEPAPTPLGLWKEGWLDYERKPRGQDMFSRMGVLVM